MGSFLIEDRVMESGNEALCYGIVNDPFDIKKQRHFHQALRFIHHYGDFC